MSRPSDIHDPDPLEGSLKRPNRTRSARGAADGPDGPRVTSPDLGLRGWLRWFWRQLTSMRVALVLLLLLAIATIPGSLFPQRGADPNGVVLWQENNPELFPILDAFPIQLFDVYGSVWFSSIYLLLFISLIGCVLPRIGHHWKAMRSAPPKTPVRLQRMEGFRETKLANPDASDADRTAFMEHVIVAARDELKKAHYRTEIQTRSVRGVTEHSVSAERGYLRETGNLVFHLALVGVLVSVAIGGGLSFHGQKVLVEGEAGMVNALIDYDSATSGTYFNDASLDPWGVRLDRLNIDYVGPEDGNAAAIGQVLEHEAFVTVFPADGAEPFEDLVRVNYPMRYAGVSVYLLANGYAPILTLHDADGTEVFREPVPFIPQDSNMTSLGVVKVPDGFDTQLGFRGFFYPSKVDLDTGAYASSYPDLENPVLTLDVYAGDLGINEGIPQSVYALDTTEMEQLTGRQINVDSLELTPGETLDLPNGLGTITLESIPRYVSFDVVKNPAHSWILIFALIATAGLLTSLFVPRRRMWVKTIPSSEGITIEYAALARGDDPTLERAVEELQTGLLKRLAQSAPAHRDAPDREE